MDFDRLCALATRTVDRAVAELPADIREAAASVPVLFERTPSPDLLAEGFEPDILGLFTGNPHGTDLVHDNPDPPRILLYLPSLWDYAEGDRRAFAEEVRLTFLHELGHYLGWDEDEVAERGLE